MTAVVASRVLGVQMFDEQILGALELADGKVIEMQTGEGKTLAAVPGGRVVTRAAARACTCSPPTTTSPGATPSGWAGSTQRMGLSVAAIDQTMNADGAPGGVPRGRHLRDGERGRIRLPPRRARGRASTNRSIGRSPRRVVDEADSILIDEARIPLVIAGGTPREDGRSRPQADRIARELLPGRHFTVDGKARNVALTPAGVDLRRARPRLREPVRAPRT